MRSPEPPADIGSRGRLVSVQEKSEMGEARPGEEATAWHEGTWGWLKAEILGCLVAFCSLGKFPTTVG